MSAAGGTFVRRLSMLSPGRVILLGEAYVLMLLAAPAVRCMPFRTLGRLAARDLRRPAPRDRAEEVARIGWAVAVAARFSPLRALCFEKGLVAQFMLRRRGIGSTLYYGVAPRGRAGVQAHVWVLDGETNVTGGSLAHEFAMLAAFPGQGERG